MGSRVYTNTAITIEKQLTILQEQGLSIDVENAEFYLERINYFRLARYLSSFKITNKQTQFKRFHKDAKLSDALSLYYFDKELRMILFPQFKQ